LKSTRQIAIREDIAFEWRTTLPKGLAFDRFRLPDPVHPQAPEIVACEASGHQIPQRWQDQHGLRFDLAPPFLTSCIAISKRPVQARYRSGAGGAIHL
jgi:hypothetical protein